MLEAELPLTKMYFLSEKGSEEIIANAALLPLAQWG